MPVKFALSSLSARRAWIEIPAGCWRDARRAVALRKESVDRNIIHSLNLPSSPVALRKESVDRNALWTAPNRLLRRSLSARRAWIEISGVDFAEDWLNVALRKESVDRNFDAVQIEVVKMSRSPQGERG